jgi:hypothetical protein
MKTLKLFTADGRALTDLASEDDSILLPTAITEYDCESVAHHADSGDLQYDTLDDLCEAYGLDVDAVQAALDAVER